MPSPQPVRLYNRISVGQPRRPPGSLRQPAVQRHGVLQGEKRPPLPMRAEVYGVQVRRFLHTRPLLHRNPLPLQPLAPTLRVRVGLHHPVDDLRDSRVADGLRARPRLAAVVARFECHVERRTLSPLTSRPKCLHLGVRPSPLPVEALADHLAPAHDHGSDHGVGSDPSPTSLGQAEGVSHEAGI